MYVFGFVAVGVFVWFACAVLAGQSFDHEDRRDEGW